MHDTYMYIHTYNDGIYFLHEKVLLIDNLMSS